MLPQTRTKCPGQSLWKWCTVALLQDITLHNSPELIQSDILVHSGEVAQ